MNDTYIRRLQDAVDRAEKAEADLDRLAKAAREVERLFYLRDEEYTEEEGGAAFMALREALDSLPTSDGEA